MGSIPQMAHRTRIETIVALYQMGPTHIPNCLETRHREEDSMQDLIDAGDYVHEIVKVSLAETRIT
jgi:hypothetical protein